MNVEIEYSSLPKKRRSWWKSALYVFASVITLVAAVWLWGWFTMETASISVAVTNQTAQPLGEVQLRCGPQVLVDLRDLPPGRKVEKSRRFFHDIGPVSFHARLGSQFFKSDSWLVLTGKGPYEYEITVYPNHAHVERWSPPKGTWKRDVKPNAVDTEALCNRGMRMAKR